MPDQVIKARLLDTSSEEKKYLGQPPSLTEGACKGPG